MAIQSKKDVSNTHIQRRTITKIKHDRRTALGRSVESISQGGLNRFYVATILALTSNALACCSLMSFLLVPLGGLCFSIDVSCHLNLILCLGSSVFRNCGFSFRHFFLPHYKHAYSNILKVSSPKTESVQTKILIFFISLLKT